MESLVNEMQELELLINSFSGNSESYQPNSIEELAGTKLPSVNELKDELTQLKQSYSNLGNMQGSEYTTEYSNFIKRLANLRISVNLYIENIGIVTAFNNELSSIQDLATTIPKTDSDQRENKLIEAQVRYENLLDYIKTSRKTIDTSTVELSIADAIINVMVLKKSRNENIDLNSLISDRFMHEVLLKIQEKVTQDLESTDEPTQKLAQAINSKMQLSLLQSKNSYTDRIKNLVYDENFMNMFLELYSEDKSKSNLGVYYSQENENDTNQSDSQNMAESIEQSAKSKLDIYKELIGIQESQKHDTGDFDFSNYRNNAISKYQSQTGKLFSIKPKSGHLTIITVDNKVKKIPINEFLNREEREKIKVIITADDAKELPNLIAADSPNLEEVVLNEGLENIGDFAFYGSSLKKLVVPQSIIHIGQGVFADTEMEAKHPVDSLEEKKELEERNFELYRTKKILEYAKQTKKDISDITPARNFFTVITNNNQVLQLPDNELVSFLGNTSVDVVTPSGKKTTLQKKNIQAIILGDANSYRSYFETNFFQDDDTYNYPVLPQYQFSGLKDLVLNNQVQTIGRTHFYGSKIHDLRFPPSMKQIGAKAFGVCKELSKIHLNEGLENIEEAAFINSNISSLSTPSTLKRISFAAFANSNHLKQLNINNGLEILGGGAFFGTPITDIELPASLNCTMTHYTKNPLYNSGPFEYCHDLRNVKITRTNSLLGTSGWELVYPSNSREPQKRWYFPRLNPSQNPEYDLRRLFGFRPEVKLDITFTEKKQEVPEISNNIQEPESSNSTIDIASISNLAEKQLKSMTTSEIQDVQTLFENAINMQHENHIPIIEDPIDQEEH